MANWFKESKNEFSNRTLINFAYFTNYVNISLVAPLCQSLNDLKLLNHHPFCENNAIISFSTERQSADLKISGETALTGQNRFINIKSELLRAISL